MVSLTNHRMIISLDGITPRNSAWFPSSRWSFGDGVAVHARRYGVAENASTRRLFVTPV